MKAPFKQPFSGPCQVPLTAAAAAGGTLPLPLVPVAKSSSITAHQADGILVQWDREMMMTCDIKDQINVIVDGGAPVHPVSIVFHATDKSKMGLIMAVPFQEMQTVSWAYDDQGSCDLQEVAASNTEADNQTYGVNNHLHKPGMITVWRTQADGDSVTLPAIDTHMDCTIDWGDGSTHEHITAPNPSHVYAVAGDHTVTIHGEVHQWKQGHAGDKDKLLEVKQLGDCNWKNLRGMFDGCAHLTKFRAAPCVTDHVISMGMMFQNCIGFTTPPDLTGLNTANVLDMHFMFAGLSNISTPVDVSFFDTHKVTALSAMFSGWKSCTTPPDLRNFVTSAVTKMDHMCLDWWKVTTPPDFTNFDTTHVTSFNAMCANWKSMTIPPDFSSFTTTHVRDIHAMLQGWSQMGAVAINGITTFNIAALSSATNFLKDTILITTFYDRILIAWAAQTPNIQHGININFGTAKYTCGPASDARKILTDTYGWTIIDGGPEGGGPCIGASAYSDGFSDGFN